jgi:hypothetical protein
MSSPLPKDPLDEPITRFVTAVNEFLAIKAADIDPPEQQAKTQNPIEDIKRSWEEFKRQLRKSHEVLVGAEPEVDERLQKIVSVGSEAVALTDDPHIVGPIENLVRMATEQRVDIKNAATRLGEATSFLNVLAVFGDLAGIGQRAATRKKEIATALDALTAYYLLRQMPPDFSA